MYCLRYPLWLITIVLVMKITRLVLPLSVLFCMAVTVSCKPTEQNYKSAYETAVRKNRESSGDADMHIPEGKLLTDEKAEAQKSAGLPYNLATKFISPLESGISLYKYNVAVASFKMPTNCISLAERLVKDGYDAFAVKDAEERYYTVAASFASKDEAVAFAQKFEKNHASESFIGLGGKPLIIEKPR